MDETRETAFGRLLTLGAHLRQALLDDAAVAERTTRIIPVVTQTDQPMPFVTYYRTGVESVPVKTGAPSRVSVWQFNVYTAEWTEGVALAARICAVLDGMRDDTVRMCRLADAAENHDPNVPAFVQTLTFEVRGRE